MADLEFFNRNTRRPLFLDTESDCAVIGQFADWFVRVVSDQAIIPTFMMGDQFIPLIWNADLDGYALPTERSYKDDVKKIASSAGLLTLYHKPIAGAPSPLVPSLYIGPGSLTEQEFAAILDRLAELAIAHENAIIAPVSRLTGAPKTSKSESFYDKLTASAKSLIGLWRVMEKNWILIRRAPAEEVRLLPQIVDMTRPHNAYSARLTQLSSQHPERRRQEVPMPVEDLDTPENRFLAFVLKQVLLRHARPLAGYLRRRSSWLLANESKPSMRFGLQYLNLWKERRTTVEAEAKRLVQLADDIDSAAAWTKSKLDEPIFQTAGQKLYTPRRPSIRLRESKEYGPIYKAFREFTGGRATDWSTTGMGLMWALEECPVHEMWRLFELWTFIEIYGMFVDAFGFQPIGRTPFEMVRTVSGELMLPERSPFRLVFSPKNETASMGDIELSLTYTPLLVPPACTPGKRCFSSSICPTLPCYREIMTSKNWAKGLTPDVLIELKAKGVVYRFVIDAKYRRYEAQRDYDSSGRQKFEVDSIFDLDVLGTAKMKYRDGLGCNAAFIIHSDPEPRFTIFGSEPLANPPHRERNQGQVYYPAHRFGAVFASPSQIRELEKLLRCFLMYQAGLENICWSCRNVLTLENGGLTKQPDWVGDYYQCPDCGRFWIRTHCQGPEHHRLVKMGRDSFHKTEPDNEWNCVCPVCGDELAARQIGLPSRLAFSF